MLDTWRQREKQECDTPASALAQQSKRGGPRGTLDLAVRVSCCSIAERLIAVEQRAERAAER